jgi:small-conductance mechanosensitive channel
MPSFMKSRQWLVTLALFFLVLAASVTWFLTRDNTVRTNSSTANQEKGTAELVDQRPLEAARAMGKLATGADERRVADEALRLADNEVDLAFRDASRDAADHPPQANAKFREFYQHAAEVEADVKADQDRVKQLQKDLASAKAADQVSLQEQLDVAQAQLELDQDELDDAKEDLVRSGADPGALIQRQFEEHQAAEHSNPQAQQTAASAVDYRANNFLGQFAAWRALRVKIDEIQEARDQAGKSAEKLSQSHNALEKQVSAEKKNQRMAALQAASIPKSSPSFSPAQSSTAAAVRALHVLSDDQKNLADFDKRIQDEQQLQATYGQWIALIRSQQRVAMHGMVQSALWVLLIIFAVYLIDRVVDHYIAEGPERTRLHTLRAVIRFAIQAVGVLLILLVILGAPNQMPTIIGLAGAGLTVALKDFIVAFFGWFVLMGKNGIRVGDWVEINGVAGEVIEINLLRTVLLETGNWASTGHPTGRKVSFVNSYAIEGHFFNFTTSGQWLWDEIHLLVPADRDPYAMIEEIQKTVAKETEASVREAEDEWKRITSRYRVRSVSAAPAVNLRPTGSGIEVHVRYICRAHDRYALRARLNQALVQLLRGKEAHARQPASAGN